jgi:hypothetical protein
VAARKKSQVRAATETDLKPVRRGRVVREVAWRGNGRELVKAKR